MIESYGVTFTLTIRVPPTEIADAADRLMDSVAELTDNGAVSVDLGTGEIAVEVMATSRGSTVGAQVEARSVAFAAAERAGFTIDEHPTGSTHHSSTSYLVRG